MNGICQIVNNTEKVITWASLGHSTEPISPLTPESLVKVLTIENLNPTDASVNATFPQESFTLDYWAMIVKFEGEPLPYYLYNGVLAFAECETPSNGAASLHILGNTDMSVCRIDTFENQNYSDFDGSCDELIALEATIVTSNPANAEIIAFLKSALGPIPA